MNQDKVIALIEQGKFLRRKELERCAEIDAQIIELQRRRERIAGTFVGRRKKIERVLLRVFDRDKLIADTFRDAVLYKASYYRRGWNLDALDNLADKKPDVWRAIKKFRKMILIDSALSIKD